MFSQNYIKINPSLRTYISNSINSSINKKCELLLKKDYNFIEKRENEKENENALTNNNISGLIFFLSLSIIHFLFSQKK